MVHFKVVTSHDNSTRLADVLISDLPQVRLDEDEHVEELGLSLESFLPVTHDVNNAHAHMLTQFWQPGKKSFTVIAAVVSYMYQRESFWRIPHIQYYNALSLPPTLWKISLKENTQL